tara:strand:+ start:759 stop:965 length:207 start_codon:yes stop_codon:yes gene_type:complete
MIESITIFLYSILMVLIGVYWGLWASEQYGTAVSDKSQIKINTIINCENNSCDTTFIFRKENTKETKN